MTTAKHPRKTLRSQAYDSLEELIVSQVLKPGAQVTEEELVQRTGIGRTPVREALQRLARDGLVSIRPRSAIAARLQRAVAGGDGGIGDRGGDRRRGGGGRRMKEEG